MTTMTPTTEAPAQPTMSHADTVLHVLQAAPAPLPLANIGKLANLPKKPKDLLDQVMRTELLPQGKVFACTVENGKTRFWAKDEEQVVTAKILELLQSQPQTEAKLLTAVAKALPKVSKPDVVKGFIAKLKTEGRVHEHPVASKGAPKPPLLATYPHDPFAGFKFTSMKSLQKDFEKFRNLRGSVDRFMELLRSSLIDAMPMPEKVAADQPVTHPAPTSHATPTVPAADTMPAPPPVSGLPEIDRLILKGMADVEPNVAEGAPVSLRELRRHMPTEYQSHHAFDQAVLRLAREDKIVVHRHDQPHHLLEEERDELVRDENGNFYTTIAQRV